MSKSFPILFVRLFCPFQWRVKISSKCSVHRKKTSIQNQYILCHAPNLKLNVGTVKILRWFDKIVFEKKTDAHFIFNIFKEVWMSCNVDIGTPCFYYYAKTNIFILCTYIPNIYYTADIYLLRHYTCVIRVLPKMILIWQS